MVYCGKIKDKLVGCYPSLCSEASCTYRSTAITQYISDRELVLACHINWCKQRCILPCGNGCGVICDKEIEQLLDRGLTVEDVLGVDLSCIHKVIRLDTERFKRRSAKDLCKC